MRKYFFLLVTLLTIAFFTEAQTQLNDVIIDPGVGVTVKAKPCPNTVTIVPISSDPVVSEKYPVVKKDKNRRPAPGNSYKGYVSEEAMLQMMRLMMQYGYQQDYPVVYGPGFNWDISVVNQNQQNQFANPPKGAVIYYGDFPKELFTGKGDSNNDWLVVLAILGFLMIAYLLYQNGKLSNNSGTTSVVTSSPAPPTPSVDPNVNAGLDMAQKTSSTFKFNQDGSFEIIPPVEKKEEKPAADQPAQ